MKNILIVATLGLLVMGCAPTTGTNREYDIPVTVSSNTGTVNITLEMKVDATSATDQTATPAISPTTRLQLTEGGSTAAGEASTLSDVASKWIAEQSKKDSEDPVTNNNQSTTTVKPDSTVVTAVDEEKEQTGTEEPVTTDTVFTKMETFTYYNTGDNGKHAWRIPKVGTSFGKTIKLVFESGYTAVIPDTSKRFAKKNGLIYRPGTGEKVGTITNDIQTSHGGIYLYAPVGDTSKTVTIYYD